MHFMRGAAEDLIYTDEFKSSDNVSMRGNSSGFGGGELGFTL